VRTSGVTAPDPDASAVLARGYAAYERIYPALRDIYRGASTA
jgi:hypothetical protein